MVQRGPKSGHLRFLTNDNARDIHVASLEILESVGMACPSTKIMDIFQRAGAWVDVKEKRIRIPQSLVEESLKKAPKEIVFCGRNPQNDILLDDSRVYFGMGGTPVPYIRDIENGEIRRPTKEDMNRATRLGDALPNFKFLMTIAGAYDVPYEVEYIHELEALFNNTEKPILYSCPGGYAAQKVLEMASTIVGGKEELRKRPILTLYTETVSPLSFSEVNENMIEFAKAGVPVSNGPMPMCGASGPMTLAGTAVQSNAESLAAITLCQLVNPHTPVIYTGWVCAMDARTSRCAYGAPEFGMGTSIFCTSMGRYYDIPTYGFGGCSDSKMPDAQAGAEVMMNGMLAALGGVNLIHDCGYLAGGSIGSMEMAVVCNEIVGMILRIVRGVKVDEETLAVDVIKNVGPGGHYMSQKHTLDHVRELYQPTLFDRESEVTWVKAGKKDVRDMARMKAKQILQEHTPTPLPKDVQLRLREIVKETEKQLVKTH
jgi:trimethylamine--corrinoid protein Co-methyltransferase